MTAVDLNNIIGEHIGTLILFTIVVIILNGYKIPKIVKKIAWGLVLLGVFKLIYLIIWAYNYEPPLNESRKFLNRTTEETEVYIDGLKVVEPQFIISKLKKAKDHVMRHGHSHFQKQINEYIIVIKNRDENMSFKLRQDTEWEWEYSIYNLYLDEILGDTRTIFNEPIKVIKDGKVIEKKF